MEYKVVPFIARLDQKNESTKVIANQLERLITQYNNYGWKYIRLEGVSTYVQADSGCFGIGAKPGYIASYQMIVFSKEGGDENTTTSNH